MLVPKRAKYRKQQRGMMKGNANRGTTVAFGEFGLMSDGMGWVTARQIEAARKAITHSTQRGGRVWIRIFPDKPITKNRLNQNGIRKGRCIRIRCPIRPGRVLFEMGGVTKEIAHEALRLAGHKLGIKTMIVEKDN